MLNVYKLLIILTMISINLTGHTQTGPEIPCPDCQQLNKRVLPSSGIWHNPDQPGNTFSFESQNRRIKGIYYGYNAKGDATWYKFNGLLIPSAQDGVMWELDTQLHEQQNGTCINCQYQKPSNIGNGHQLHINFNHLGHASFNIDKGLTQNIIAQTFGVETFSEFPTLTSLQFPYLKGNWVFASRDNPQVNPNTFIAGFRNPKISWLTEPSFRLYDDGTSLYGHVAFELTGFPEGAVPFGGVSCNTIIGNDGIVQGPKCGYGTGSGTQGAFFNSYQSTITGLGESMLFGETSDGHVAKGFRFDYCGFNESDWTEMCEYQFEGAQ